MRSVRMGLTVRVWFSVVMAAVFSPDESLVISCSQDKTVKVWNVQTGKSVRTFAGHEE